MAEEPNAKTQPRGQTVKKCEDMIQRSLRIPTVKFLVEHLEKAGCGIGHNFIKAVNCDMEAAGGFISGEGIVVCSNKVERQDDVNQVLIHELIHAYDDCRAENLDWRNCAHHACSEIRAGHLSGDCHFKRELLRGYLRLRGHEQDCVKRRVMKSLLGNPNCSKRLQRMPWMLSGMFVTRIRNPLTELLETLVRLLACLTLVAATAKSFYFKHTD